MTKKIAIIGNGSWGTALGVALAGKGIRVNLLTRSEDEAKVLNKDRENKRFLSGFPFPPSLSATSLIDEALDSAGLVILAVPAQSMRYNVKRLRDYLHPEMLIVSATKGLEMNTGKQMSQLIAEEIDTSLEKYICVLSGPNIARETAQGLHSLAVVAAEDITQAEKAREIINASCFQIFTTTDVVGVELGGALKNIVALSIGMLDGLGYGNNTKAALVTQGLAEIATLGTALGAKVITFYGLSCLGDIITTSFSPLSRNHRVGVELARAHSLEEITNSMPHVAEGIATTMAAWKLARRLEIKTPMIEQLYKVLFLGLAPGQAVSELINQLAEPQIKDESIRYFVLPAQPTYQR